MAAQEPQFRSCVRSVGGIALARPGGCPENWAHPPCTNIGGRHLEGREWLQPFSRSALRPGPIIFFEYFRRNLTIGQEPGDHLPQRLENRCLWSAGMEGS